MKNIYAKILAVSFIAVILCSSTSLAQNNNIGIGTFTPDASAMLEILSNDKGLLVPRMTATERMAIPTPANALLVYDTDSTCFFYYKLPTTEWINLCNAFTEMDADTTNELQQLSLSGDTIFISNGNYIVLPGISSLTHAIVGTYPITNTSYTSAASGGYVASDGGSSITARGICWSLIPSPTITDSITSNGTGTGFYSSALTGLTLGSTYYVRAYATNAEGTSYGNEINFTTLDTLAALTTSEVTAITTTTASTGGTISLDGGAAVTARGVCWSTSPNPTTADSVTTDGTGTGSFTSSLTSLTGGASYYVRAYATNGVGTSYGNEVNFTTLDTTATLTTTEVTAITTTTASTGGNVSSDGGAVVIARGVCWSTSPNPTTADSITTDGSGTGSYTSSINGLTNLTLYYVRAYATNNVGTAYGNEFSFTANLGIQERLDTNETPKQIFNSGVPLASLYGKTYQGGLIAYLNTSTGAGLVAAPTDQSTNAPWGCHGTWVGADETALGTGAQNTVDIVAGCGTAGIAAYICDTLSINSYSDWFLPSKDELNQLYRNLQQNGLGTFASSLYWSSTEYSSFNVATQYFINGAQQSSFKDSPSYHVRAVRTFTTLATITTISVNGISNNTASAGGHISSDGGELVTARGFCWSTNPNPTTADSVTANGAGTGTYLSNITGLTTGTSYYLRAYATNSIGTAYGNELTFQTQYVQARLDAGETPKQIYNSGIPLDSLYGKTYMGGIIAYLDTISGTGFVAAPTDQSTGAEWGCYGTLIPGADGWAIGTGAQNTIDIEAGCTTAGTAADICANLTLNGHSDWFLPSIEELNQLHQNLHLNGFGAFTSDYYWSSTEGDSNAAVLQNFNDGGWSGGVKFSNYHVRPVRAFAALATITTNPVVSTGINTASTGGNISSDGGAMVTARGVCWSSSHNPTTANNITNDGTGTGNYSSSLTGLTTFTSYYVRAYATNSAGTSYGNEINFTVTVQWRLDNSETPKQIYDSGILLDSLYGKTYQGGLIAYLNTSTGAGFVAAPTDQGTNTYWGCESFCIGVIPPVYCQLGTSIGSGAQNTIDIMTGCYEPGIAAKLCGDLVLNGFSDWFLPSKDELNQLYLKLHVNGLGNFSASDFYWSSSEYDSFHAWCKSFLNGNQNNLPKNSPIRVRAVRAF